MQFFILGPTALNAHDRDIALGVAKQRGLLALLLYHAGEPVRVETIVEHLWEDRTVDECRDRLYALASRTRAALRTAGLPEALSRVPSTGAYRLNIDPSLVDYHRFRRSVVRAREAARAGQHGRATGLLEDAIDLWRDEPLADLHGPRSDQIRRHMNDALLTAIKLLADNQLRIGRHEAVLARLEPFMRIHDLDETLAQLWIAALRASGRDSDARDFATEFRKRFRRRMRTDPSVDPPPLTVNSMPSTVAPPHQLPHDIPDFRGHDDLLAELDTATSTVVLEGMPGVGKTTIATHWGQQRRDRFPDGRLHLAADAHGPTPPVTPEEALGRFLQALGVPRDRIPAGEDQRRERFNQLLENRRVLIVLDNVLNSEQARPLIPTSSSCLTIITSRNRLSGLNIRSGARSITVPPLPAADGLGLLRSIIGPARADHELDAVRDLVRLSDGLPLALRVIGEHVVERPEAPVADLVEELTGQLLDHEGEDGDEATLRTVFAWSYRRLDPDAALLFRFLGLYPGRTVSPAAAGALLGTDERHAERVLNALARAHLINHGAARRFRFHDVLRLYSADLARSEIAADDRHTALRRLLDWALLSAVNAARVLAPHRDPVPDLPEASDIEPHTFATDAAAMAWCEAERVNLTAMVRAAAEHGFHRHAWQIPGACHEWLSRFGRQDDVLEIHHIALAAAEVDGHMVAQIGTSNNLAGTYFATHDYEHAAHYFTRAVDLARDIGDSYAMTTGPYSLASVRLKSGAAATAVDIYLEVLDACRGRSDPGGEAATLYKLGDAFGQMKRYKRSAACYLEALSIHQRTGMLRGQAATHGQLASLQLETGRPHDALTHCELALKILDQVMDEVIRCRVLTTAADAHRGVGRYPEALLNAREAVAISDRIGDSHLYAQATAALADVLVVMDELQDALFQVRLALGIASDIPAGPESRALRDRLLATHEAITPGDESMTANS